MSPKKQCLQNKTGKKIKMKIINRFQMNNGQKLH